VTLTPAERAAYWHERWRRRNADTTPMGEAWRWLTWRDMVAMVAGDDLAAEMDEEDIEWLLWERTAYPMAGAATVYGQLTEWLHNRPREEQ
jgi:hypothetical protein